MLIVAYVSVTSIKSTITSIVQSEAYIEKYLFSVSVVVQSKGERNQNYKVDREYNSNEIINCIGIKTLLFNFQTGTARLQTKQ